MTEKKPKVKLGLKNLAMLSSYFDYILVHLKQKAFSKKQNKKHLRLKLSPRFWSTLGLNLARTRPKSPARLTTLVGCSYSMVVIFYRKHLFFIPHDCGHETNQAAAQPRIFEGGLELKPKICPRFTNVGPVEFPAAESNESWRQSLQHLGDVVII